MGKKAKSLATADYENKMFACFKEMNRVLHPDGVLTVMFTHKQVQAWDMLGSSLMRANFRIDASWPVHTEAEANLQQAKKNSAVSTILLVCRKREASSEPAWWDDLKGQVRKTARETAQRFEKEGIGGVDLYVSTFGPVLSIISERWPVLTSNTDTKTGDPIPVQPSEALDLARHEVINLRKQGLLLGRSIEFDPVTDWYLMAWDAFRARSFPPTRLASWLLRWAWTWKHTSFVTSDSSPRRGRTSPSPSRRYGARKAWWTRKPRRFPT